MEITENVSLASLTTFKIGGNALYVARCETIEDIQSALAFAGERALPCYVLSGGSNVLASDKGYEGLIIQPFLKGITFEEKDTVLVSAAAGEGWDALVQESVERDLWGLENLAGIPGLVGGAPIQNIGAYGAEVAHTIVSVETFNMQTNQVQRFTNSECEFGYRDSFFKRNPYYVILSVTFSLSTQTAPHIHYADLTAYQEKNGPLTTPRAIAAAVREVRSHKFPDLRVSGTAGSFFKNPFIPKAQYDLLATRYEGLPGFPLKQEDNSKSENKDDTNANEVVKIPLAWILDKVLGLRGFSMGPVRLFEVQPLVVVAEEGATEDDVDALSREVSKKVFDATGITIEREVRVL